MKVVTRKEWKSSYSK